MTHPDDMLPCEERCTCNCWDEEKDFCIDCGHDGAWNCPCTACQVQRAKDEAQEAASQAARKDA